MFFLFFTVIDSMSSDCKNQHQETLESPVVDKKEESIEKEEKKMDVEMVQRIEELPKEETQVEDFEEELPDGTVHHTHKVKKQSFQTIKTVWKSSDGEEIVEEEKKEIPGSLKENVLETFTGPPKLVTDEEDIEEILADGTVVQKKLVTKRMVHKFRTHEESFDSDHGHKVEDFEIDEVVPGTESAFVELQKGSESECSDEKDSCSSDLMSREGSEELSGKESKESSSERSEEVSDPIIQESNSICWTYPHEVVKEVSPQRSHSPNKQDTNPNPEGKRLI